jgi:heme A synthase
MIPEVVQTEHLITAIVALIGVVLLCMPIRNRKEDHELRVLSVLTSFVIGVFATTIILGI